jgi:hypothetical protein
VLARLDQRVATEFPCLCPQLKELKQELGALRVAKVTGGAPNKLSKMWVAALQLQCPLCYNEVNACMPPCTTGPPRQKLHI